MHKRFTIYIDVHTDKNQFAFVLDLIEKYTEVFEPITRVLKTWDLPDHVYDLLIVDADKLTLDEMFLSGLKRHYGEVILLNCPDNLYFLSVIYNHGISLWLKKGYLSIELDALIANYMNKKQLENENTILDNIIHSAQNSIVITDKKGNIEFANPYFELTSGYSTDEFMQKTPNVIRSGFHEDAFYDDLWGTIKSGQVWEGIFVNTSKNQERFYEEATITPLKNSHGEIEKFLKIGKNITRERLLLDELSKEVKLARKVIDALLPSAYSDDRVKFDYNIMHYNEIGGDFIYFGRTDTDRYHFALVDVMGHGISSALIALTVTQMFEDYAVFKPLSESVEAINSLLCTFNLEHQDRNKYVTGIFMEINFSENLLKIINAGHLDILLLDKNENPIHLRSNNMILGVLDSDYVTIELTLSEIKKLFCFTDGLYENNGIEYEDALNTIDTLIRTKSSENLFGTLLSTFGIEQDIRDDVTLCQILF